MTRQLLLTYYIGAYGPTVRIDVQRLEDLAAVGQLLRRLASGEILEEDFGRTLECHLDAIGSLIVRSVKFQPSKSLKLEHFTSRGPVFCWSNTGEDWLDGAEKVEVLVAEESPGHQYLTREGVDDALVEVCYRE